MPTETTTEIRTDGAVGVESESNAEADDRVRVLHVDDDPDFAELTALYLEREDDGFEVETAASAAEALDRLAEASYDVIVSDYDMPRVDGIEFLRQVRRQFPDVRVPFVLLTGKGSEEVAAEALHAGATSYVRKGGPDTYEYVVERIRRDIRAARDRRDSDRFGTVVEALEDPVYVLDSEGRFTYVNDALVDLVGYRRADLLGATPSLIKSPDAVASAERHLGLLLSDDGPDSITFEVEIQPRAGEPVPCEDHMGVLPYRGERFRGSAGVLRDVSERKAREREREETIEFVQELYDVATDPATSFEGKVDRLLRIGTERIGLPYGFLTRIETEDSGGERRQFVVRAVGSHERLQPGASAPLSEAYCRKTIETDDLLAVADTDEAGWVDDPARLAFDLGSYIGGKVTDGDELYGTFCFASTAPRDEPFTEAERAFVRLLSKWVSYEVERHGATLGRAD